MIGEARPRFRKTQQRVKQTETTVTLTQPAWKFQRNDVRSVVMVDSMAGEAPSFSKSAKIPEADVSTPIGPETVSKPAKPTLPEPLEVFSVDYQLFVLACEVYRNTDLFGQVNLRGVQLSLSGRGGDGSPISGLNLLAEEVEKGTRSDNVIKIHRRTLVGCLPFGLMNLTSFRRNGKVVKRHRQILKITRHRQRMIR
ncbi:hypothetical protein HID58_003998 [Brassica napus]|uniref:Uncharacterized protein n=1 Tax=Brassica napus TaxID=3708 RepID=A0ABQ7XJU4_BRANA|nr:hypothetical protein HID58_003998 [Brassica napus]